MDRAMLTIPIFFDQHLTHTNLTNYGDGRGIEGTTLVALLSGCDDLKFLFDPTLSCYVLINLSIYIDSILFCDVPFCSSLVYRPVYLPTCLSVHCLSIYPSIHLLICPSI